MVENTDLLEKRMGCPLKKNKKSRNQEPVERHTNKAKLANLFAYPTSEPL